jgi:hypothetical protein
MYARGCCTTSGSCCFMISGVCAFHRPHVPWHKLVQGSHGGSGAHYAASAATTRGCSCAEFAAVMLILVGASICAQIDRAIDGRRCTGCCKLAHILLAGGLQLRQGFCNIRRLLKPPLLRLPDPLLELVIFLRHNSKQQLSPCKRLSVS